MLKLREKTPPDVKWLLVERATIAGNIVNMEKCFAELKAELVAQRASLADAERKCAAFPSKIAHTKQTLTALDTVIRLTDVRVNRIAGGIVRAHNPRYQRRGALKELIISAIKAAGDVGIRSHSIANLVVDHFELTFASKAEFVRFKANSVQSRIKFLHHEDLIELAPSNANTSARCFWRWKNHTQTFATLAEQSRLAASE